MAEKTIDCDVMKPKNEAATGLTMIAAVAAIDSHECRLASKHDKLLGGESSEKDGHLNENILVSEAAEVARQKSFGVETQISTLSDTSTLDGHKPEVELCDAPCGCWEESREKSMTGTVMNQVDDTCKGIPFLSSGTKAQSIEVQNKPAMVSQSDEDSHNAVTNLSCGMEDEQDTPFTSPSQLVSVREALSIFDTPPSCATLKKKSVPRRSRRLRKMRPNASGDSGSLNIVTMDDDSPQLMSDNDGAVGKRCDSNGNLLSGEASSGVNAIEIGVNKVENPSPLKTKFSGDLERRPSEAETVQMDVKRMGTGGADGCQPQFYGTTAQLPADDALRFQNLDSVSSGRQEMLFEMSTSCDRMSPSSKRGGDDGFTQISQATLSAVCEVVDNVSVAHDRPRCAISSERSTAISVRDIDAGAGSEKTVVACRKDCNDKRYEEDSKELSACAVSGALKLSPIAESRCHVTEVNNCGRDSAASNGVCSAVSYSNGGKACCVGNNVHSALNQGHSNEVCIISTTSCDMNKVCSAPSADTRCVDARVKVCSAGTNALRMIGQSEDNGRSASNEDIAFTQISQSLMDEMLQAADSSHDAHAVTSVKVDSDPSTDDRLPDPPRSDWSRSRSHNFCTTPNKILHKHSSRENECELLPDRGNNQKLSKHHISPDCQRNVEGSHVAKQQESSVGKSKNLSFANKKRFSYPSAQQISSMCPQRVFNLKTDAFGVTDMFTRNTVDSVDVKSSGKTDPSASIQSCSGVSVTSSNVVAKVSGEGKTPDDMISLIIITLIFLTIFSSIGLLHEVMGSPLSSCVKHFKFSAISSVILYSFMSFLMLSSHLFSGLPFSLSLHSHSHHLLGGNLLFLP